jgi:thiamine-monophosphate kinase
MLAGEFALIDTIRQRASGRAELQLGIGDDCSILQLPAGHELLTSTDLLLEGVHFRLDWTDLPSLGFKSVAVNVSDLAAMGGNPLALYLGVGLPADFSDAQLTGFLDGIFTGLTEYDLALAGGDTCRSRGGMMISVTVQGSVPKGQAILRSGASPGDDLWVSGTLGDSALALRTLGAGLPVSAFLAERHFRPSARLRLGTRLAEQQLATAMIDLSDGLSGDLRHLLKASETGARVEVARLPLSAEFNAALRADPGLLDLALCGGEDYELLFCAHPAKRAEIELLSQFLALPLRRIGGLTAETDLKFCLANGQAYQPQRAAFDHFRPGKDGSA